MFKMISEDKKYLEESYKRCSRKFIKIDRSLFIEYQDMAYEDLDSAIKENNPRWALNKAYQALFLMCNSILARKKGVYSKNHECVLIALIYNDLIPKEIMDKIDELLKNKEKLSLFDEISNIRIIRNRYLYLPKTLRKSISPVKEVINEIKEIIKILGEIES